MSEEVCTRQALKAVGKEGLGTAALVEAVVAAGVKTWEDQRIAKSSVASTCTHDPAFARLQKGRFALRVLRPDLEVPELQVRDCLRLYPCALSLPERAWHFLHALWESACTCSSSCM